MVLKNGDIVTGTVIKKDGDKLTLHSEFLGDVTMPWSAIKSLKSDQELNVVLPGGETVKGKLSTSGDNLEVAATGGEKTAALTAVSAVRNDAEQHNFEKMQHPGFFRIVDRQLQLRPCPGARQRPHGDVDEYRRCHARDHQRQDRTSLQRDLCHRTGQQCEQRHRKFSQRWVGIRPQLQPEVVVSATNDYDHDRFQSLDLRAVFGGGLGWNALKTPKAQLSVQAGADYEREAFMAGITRNTAEVNFGDDLAYKFSPAINLTESFRMYPNLSDTGQYRIDFNLSAVTSIRKWLGWHVTFTDNFLSNPVLGRLRNDLVLSTGFQMAFASK
ncbi:MAG: DUF481 domain-containing protein [Ignavibacteriota bacterium]